MSSFEVNKSIISVYNQYQKTDFKVGTDNLNPLREIGLTSLEDLQAFQEQLYIQYQAKIQEFLARQQILEASSNASEEGVASANLGLPYEDKTNMQIPLMTLESQSFQNGIGTGVYGTGPNDLVTGTGSGVNSSRMTIGPGGQPINVGKVKIVDPLSQLAFDLMKILDAFMGGVPIGLDDLPFDICGDRTTVAGGTGTGGNYGNMAGGVGGTGVGSSGASGAKSQASASSDLQCLMIELEFLKTIMSLLTFIKKVIQIERKILAILYPIIDIITKIINAIFNPGERKRIIMDLVGMAIAIAISWLFDFIQNLIGGLDLNCLAASSMSVVRSLLGTVAGVKDVGSDAKAFIDFQTVTQKKLMAVKKKTQATLDLGMPTSDAELQEIQTLAPESAKLLVDHFRGSFVAF